MFNHNKRIKNYNSANVMVIFEGIGGSGKAFVLACWKLFQAWLMNVEAWVKFSVLDIDPEAEDELGEMFYDEGDCPTHNFIAELENRGADYVGVEHLGDLNQVRKAAGSSNKLSKGAQSSRLLGKLALLWQIWRHRARLLDFLTRSIFALKAIGQINQFGYGAGCSARDGRDGNEARPQSRKRLPPVVIVQSASACGGVGAGQLLDVADMRHYLCHHKWGVTEYELYCDLLLPEIFNHDDDRLKANTWATLLEIESRYDGRRHAPHRLGTITLDRVVPPWTGITLWNRMNARGLTYSGRDEVVKVMAEVNRMKYFGPVGERYQSELVNHASYPEGHFCSAAGGWRLTIEVEALEALGGLRLGRRLIGDYLLRQLPEEQAEQWAKAQVDDFVHRIGLLYLVSTFERDKHGRPIRESLERFRGERRQDLPAKIVDFKHKFFTAAGPALQEVGSQKASDLGWGLAQQVEQWLNAPDGGVLQAIRCLGRLAKVVEKQQQKVRTQSERKRAELSELEERAQADRSWLKRLLKGPRDDYLGRHQVLLDLHLELMKLTATQELLAALMNQVVDQGLAMQRWVKTLEHLKGELERREAQLSRDREADRPVCVQNVLCPAEEDTLVQEQLEARWETAKDNLRFRWEGDRFTLVSFKKEEPISGPASLWTEEGVVSYLKYAGEFFDFQHLSIEEWLARGPKTAEQWLAEFEILAAPLVSLDAARHPEPVKIQIMGAEKGPAGFFKPVVGRAGWSVVETGDPHNVVVLISYQHLTWRLLSQASSWEEAYDRRAANESLHVFAEWHRRLSGAGGDGVSDQEAETEPVVEKEAV